MITNVGYGFLCEFDSRDAYFFNCKTRKLNKLPITYDTKDLVLGKSYEIRHQKITEEDLHKRFKGHVNFYNVSGYVFVDTVATMPENLPEFEKFRGRVWSQYLGFLRDPKNLYAEKFCGGELGWVNVKYAPDEEAAFEIVEVDGIGVLMHDEEVMTPPWSPEYSEKVHHPSRLIIPDKNRHLSLSRCFATHSVCVETNVRNAAYNPTMTGSTKKCQHLFTLNLGIFRCLQNAELGAWYQHGIQDRRRHSKNTPEQKINDQYHSITAVKLSQIEAPLPTRIFNGNVEFEVEFPFDHDVLENEENRRIPDWFQRFNGLKKDAHFWNEYLGKVEIYPRHAKEIIMRVDAYRTTLSEPFKSNPITVVATVSRHFNSMENNKTYPDHGIFLVTNVIGIKDVNGGFY